MVNVEYSEAITEVCDILENMEEKYVNKIPEKFREFLKKNKSEEYKPNLDHTKRIADMDLKNKTKDILSVIYMDYWCDEEKKNECKKILEENQKIYDELINKKYNVDNLFVKKENIEALTINAEEKQSIFTKVINFIKNIFK